MEGMAQRTAQDGEDGRTDCTGWWGISQRTAVYGEDGTTDSRGSSGCHLEQPRQDGEDGTADSRG